jgi:PAS domain S-box-containing protein
VVWVAALAAAYFVTARLGLLLPTVGTTVTLIWPPTGIGVFALCCWGRRYWPGVAAGALAINLALMPAWAAVGVTVGNTLAVLVAASALQWAGFRGTYSGRWDVVKLTVFGSAAPMLISAANGPGWLILNGDLDWSGYLRAASIWWAGDMAGVLVVAPVLFNFRAELDRWRRSGLQVWAAVWLAVIGGATAVAFTPISPIGAVARPIGMAPLLLLAWACIGFRGWVASVGVVLVCVIAAFGTATGGGPFAGSPPNVQLFQLWVYFLLVTLVTATVTAVLSEQEAAERGLAGREAEYRALVDDNPAMILRFDHAGVISFANDTYCRFKGATRQEVVGRNVLDLIVGPSREAVRQLFDRFHREGGPLTFHGAFADHAGAERWVEWKGRPVGENCIQAVGLDVTERRRLEQRVAQAQKLESLGAIAGGVAHDFNNLLTGVLGHADLAAARVPPDSPERAHLTAVMDAATRAADLSRQLLAYAGKGRLLVRPVDAGAVAERAIELAAGVMPPTVTVVRRFAPDLPPIDADETQIQQVILNLLRNAVDAVGHKPGRIEVETTVEEVRESADSIAGSGELLPAGRYARVVVRDTGGGIPPDLLPRIFDPFVTTKFMGRGLGLAAVQGIVRAHRGAVRVNTAPDRGTAVSVLFPVSADVPGRAAESTITPIDPPNTDRRRTVLVADDEEAVREMTAHMLRQLGWEVLTAVDGKDAVTRFRRAADRIRFVVLDLTMPEMDGWQAMAALRRDHPELPILLCTGHNEDSVPGTDGRTTALLLKPFRLADLRHAVMKLLAPAHTSGSFRRG